MLLSLSPGFLCDGGGKNVGKKIAVLVREGQVEALRMAVGLTLADDEVTVFIVDDRLDVGDDAVSLNLETLNELGVKIYSNNPGDKFAKMSMEEIARVLPNYDTVLPY
jgi:hypothetical protein